MAAANFNDIYLERLQQGDPDTERHFADYFCHDLDRWLRPRLRCTVAVEDVRQETLCRVLIAVRRNPALYGSGRLPLFVHGVCRRVLLEYWRKSGRATGLLDAENDADIRSNPEQKAFVAENHQKLRAALASLPADTQNLLTLVYFEERNRAEVSRRIGVDQNYLRVLIHRAIRRLREVIK